MTAIAVMMATTDPVTSIPVHRSTLKILQRIKNSAETWDEFLFELTDDFLSPSLRAELDERLKRESVISGTEAKRQFEERRKGASATR